MLLGTARTHLKLPAGALGRKARTRDDEYEAARRGALAAACLAFTLVPVPAVAVTPAASRSDVGGLALALALACMCRACRAGTRTRRSGGRLAELDDIAFSQIESERLVLLEEHVRVQEDLVAERRGERDAVLARDAA